MGCRSPMQLAGAVLQERTRPPTVTDRHFATVRGFVDVGLTTGEAYHRELRPEPCQRGFVCRRG